MLTCVAVVIWYGISGESGEFFCWACVPYSVGCRQSVGEEGYTTGASSAQAVQELQAGWVGHVSGEKVLLAVTLTNMHVHCWS